MTQDFTLQVIAPPPAVPATSGIAIAILGAAMLVWGAWRASQGGVGRSRR